MPPVDILSTFIKADYQRSLLLFTCLTLDLHATDAEPQLALLAAFYSFPSSSLPEDPLRPPPEVFRRRTLPEEVFRRSSGRSSEAASGGLPEEDTSGRSLPEVACLPLENRAKTRCNRQINSFQI